MTALKLGRVSNLPTVWSNVVTAVALSGGAATPIVVTIAAAVSLLYVAGMFLNDAFDREIDARERPDRPIPSGDIGGELVFVAGFSLLVIGVVVLAAMEQEAGLFALLLSGAILLYNWRHKGNPVAPFIMGLCRAFVYVVAAAAIAVSPDDVLLPAVAMLAYVAGLTFTARLENVDRVGSYWPLLLMAAPLAVALPRLEPSLVAITALALLAVCAWRVVQLLRRRAAGDVGRAVGIMIAAIALNDALFSATSGMLNAVYVCLACFGLTLLFQRYVPAS
jgi:4-hydroxybenzoate polyprenyltransferase